MNDTHLYEEILGLKDPWYVAAVRLEVAKGEVGIEVRYRDTEWACPVCRNRMHIHEYTARRWRHLDSCQFKTIIVCQVPRVQCSEHGSQTVQVPWAEKQGRFTKLFERFAIAVLGECSISAACGLLGISWDEADGIKQRAVKRGLARKVGDGKGKESLEGYWNKFERDELLGIEAISIDMSAAYQQSVLYNVPAALEKLVFDRFHIMQHINKYVNAGRKEEHRELTKSGDTTLTKTRMLWLYAEENVPARYSDLWEELKGKKLKTSRAWAIKESIRNLWACVTEQEGQAFFEGWYSWAIRSRLDPVKKVARMMKKHLPNILSYFRHRITNAALEGINNKIQALIKKAFGYRNKDRFKNDILFH